MPSAVAAGGVDAPALYRQALGTMQNVREPAFLTYRTVVPGGDGSMAVSRSEDGRAEMAIVHGAAEQQAWDVAYRDADGVASVEMADGTHAISTLALFDPTWRGAFAWLKHGLGAAIAAPAATATPEPLPTTPVRPEQTPPPVVAVVRAISEHDYTISDGGATHCANGNEARRLFTAAKQNPVEHPMVEATVDLASHRFCAMTFHERTITPSLTFDLGITLRFGDVGSYYLITGGDVDGAVRPYKRPGWFRIETSFRYDGVAFPATLPKELFERETSD